MKRTALKVGEAYALSTARHRFPKKVTLLGTAPSERREHQHSVLVRFEDDPYEEEWVYLSHIKMSWDEYLQIKEWNDAVREQKEREGADWARKQADPEVVAKVDAVKRTHPLSHVQERMLLSGHGARFKLQELLELIDNVKKVEKEQSS